MVTTEELRSTVRSLVRKLLLPQDLLYTSFRRYGALRNSVRRFRDWRDAVVDNRMGVDTVSAPPNVRWADRSFDDRHHYEGIRYVLLRQYLRPLHLDSDDIFFDIGCGLGRIVCFVAKMKVQKCIGIELGVELATLARRNAATLKNRKSKIEIINCDATQADYSQGSVYLFFNPFGAQTMATVINKISETLKVNPRPIRIAYFTPLHEDVLASSKWLKLISRYRHPLYRCTATYWRNVQFVH